MLNYRVMEDSSRNARAFKTRIHIMSNETDIR